MAILYVRNRISVTTMWWELYITLVRYDGTLSGSESVWLIPGTVEG